MLCALGTVILTSCGGGGGSGSSTPAPVTSTLSFPLLKALQTSTVNGSSQTFTISGDCTGAGNLIESPATTLTTFQGVGAISETRTITGTLTVCTPASLADTTIYYYDANYMPLGYDDTAGGGAYAVYLTTPSIPTTVAVGNTGTIGTRTLYANSLKTGSTGAVALSYTIEADTANTAILNLISVKTVQYLGVTNTTQTRYRLTSTGGTTLLSEDVQQVNSNATTTHYVVTYAAPTVTTNAPSAPVAKVASISGTPYVGNNLTASYIYADANLDPEGTSIYQWLRNGVAITGANSLTYTVVSADLNTTIGFQVTPVALTGSPLTGTPVSMTKAIYAGIQQGGLSWSNASALLTIAYIWADANTYCTTSTLNGLTGWRLPTQTELISYIVSLPSPSNPPLYYWSSTAGVAGYHQVIRQDYATGGLSQASASSQIDSTLRFAVCVQ